jgi:hypothetical protein
MGGTQASSPRVDQRKSYIGRGMEGSSGRPAARPWVGETGRPFDGLRANGHYVETTIIHRHPGLEPGSRFFM